MQPTINTNHRHPMLATSFLKAQPVIPMAGTHQLQQDLVLVDIPTISSSLGFELKLRCRLKIKLSNRRKLVNLSHSQPQQVVALYR